MPIYQVIIQKNAAGHDSRQIRSAPNGASTSLLVEAHTLAIATNKAVGLIDTTNDRITAIEEVTNWPFESMRQPGYLAYAVAKELGLNNDGDMDAVFAGENGMTIMTIVNALRTCELVPGLFAASTIFYGDMQLLLTDAATSTSRAITVGISTLLGDTTLRGNERLQEVAHNIVWAIKTVA